MSAQYSNENSLEAITKVICEKGRWIVFLNVPVWDDHPEQPIQDRWKRINDFPTREDAEVAARWYQRTANRSFRRPTGHSTSL